jgi:hypothetical protein
MCGQLKRTRVVLDTLGEFSLLRRRGVRTPRESCAAGELRLGRAVGAGSQGERPERLVAEEGAARLVARARRVPPAACAPAAFPRGAPAAFPRGAAPRARRMRALASMFRRSSCTIRPSSVARLRRSCAGSVGGLRRSCAACAAEPIPRARVYRHAAIRALRRFRRSARAEAVSRLSLNRV